MKANQWIKPEGLILIEGWARDGLIDTQIAENIGISVRTLYRWNKTHKEIERALKSGKEVSDRQVENSLHKRALGYNYEEIKTRTVDGKKEITITTKHVPGDVTAQIFWLKNRTDFWKDGKALGLRANVEWHNPFNELTTEELKKIISDA